ncbi:hypothetical protein O3P69_002432 [Scylla paramamosain]|uniref:Chitin-binding type-2 domain-containing protein n=1 Tax=Scylla paramamosain TaxID=85552 RepID=A0AAW0V6P5_SCYPA
MSRLSLIFTLLAVVMVATRVAANGRDQGQPATFECPSDGYFADRGRDCIPYYHCVNGQHTVFGCQKGFKFDQLAKKCRPASVVNC